MRFISIILALLVLTSSTSKAQSTTEREEDPLVGLQDPRLEQPIDFAADGVRIAEVLAKISKLAGVTLVAGVDDNDWMVYDRKVVVYVKNTKLGKLMRELATVLRFRWKRIGNGPQWEYQLWQDQYQRAEEESLRASTEDAEKKRLREKRENILADIANLISLAQAESSSLKSTDPWRYVLATEPLGRELVNFINSCPDVRDALIQGYETTFPVATLPSAIRDTVRNLAKSYDSLLRSIGASEDHSDLVSEIDRLQITINPRSQPEQQVSFLAQSILGQIRITGSTNHLDIPIIDPSSQIARALGTAIVSLKSGVAKDEVARQLQSDLISTTKSEEKKSPDRDITSDPALRRRIILYSVPTVTTYQAALQLLAEKTGFNIVSDYFISRPVSIEGGEKTIGEYLEMIRNLFGANWEKSGDTIRFRDKEWFRKRAWEVPQVWIDYWIARGDMNDGLQFQDLVQIARLRDEQIDNTIMLNPTLVNLGAGDAARNRYILRFYSLLSDEQRTALTTTQLEATTLNDEQWETLRKALASVGAAYATVVKGSQTIKLEQSGTDIIEYKFSYYPAANETPISFSVKTGLVYRTDKEITFPRQRVIVPTPADNN
ncbi:MAG: hypothetical protein ACUVRS_01535 [Armatimonadota bacterium]